jgi:hypothetical protein
MEEGESIPNEEAVSASAETVETHEDETREETPVIDVHDAHHAANSWKEFFVHIATIVLGLLIAVGLEQAVEWVQHRREVAETREALRREHDLNVKLFALKVEEYRRITPLLETDLAIFQYLQKHPGAPQKDWPGRFSWFNMTIDHVDSAWKTAQQDNILALMPTAEVRRDTELYRRLQIVSDDADAFKKALYETHSFTIVEPDPSRLSPAVIAREIDLMNTLLLDHFLEGGAQANLAARFPEFPRPAHDQFDQILRSPIDPGDYKTVMELGKRAEEIVATEPGESP